MTMIWQLALLSAFFSILACTPQGNPISKPQPGGTEVLFDGTSLDGWEIADFGGQGEISIRDGTVVLEYGDTLTGITWKGDFPRTNYEVSLEAMRVEGTDFFCGMTFPVRESHCSLIVGGWGGPVIGISSIDGMDASENETNTLMRFERNRWYLIRLRVTGDLVQAWIDEEPVVDLDTTGRDLDIRPEVSLSRPFGIAAWVTTAALRNIVLRRLPD
jgi:hypothetical protein